MTLSRDIWRASMNRIRSRDILAVIVEKFTIARIIWGDTSSLVKRSASSIPGVTVSWRILLRWPDTWNYVPYPPVLCVRNNLWNWISWGSTKNPTGNEKPLSTPSLPNSKSENAMDGSIIACVKPTKFPKPNLNFLTNGSIIPPNWIFPVCLHTKPSIQSSNRGMCSKWETKGRRRGRWWRPRPEQ